MTEAQEYAEWLRKSQYESDGFGLKKYMARDGHNPLRTAVRGLSYERVLLCDPKTLDDILQWVKQNLSTHDGTTTRWRAGEGAAAAQGRTHDGTTKRGGMSTKSCLPSRPGGSSTECVPCAETKGKDV